ncbi:hypothetical protein ACP70R_035460 [Stipagrostis hirtigluma subsp. patula]
MHAQSDKQLWYPDLDAPAEDSNKVSGKWTALVL